MSGTIEGTGAFPRISFGIIVFNGEPFTRYCLRSLYPFAHEILVVEGGHEGTKAVATADGHSTDGTLQAIQAFIRDEDPEGKVRLITRDGFWPMTDELGRRRTAQSRAYAEVATGDYLWQIDIDEFYLPEDMRRIMAMLARDPAITQVSFRWLEFWGRPGYVLGSSRLVRPNEHHRLFKWGPGYRYVTHQPPTIHDDQGRDQRKIRWVRGETMARMGVRLYHYSHIFPWQVEQKAHVYLGQEPVHFKESLDWLQDSYVTLRRPYRLERHYYWPSWLERYDGPHPPEALRMMDDIAEGRLQQDLRPMDDAERLVSSLWYPLGAQGLRAFEPFRQAWKFGVPPAVNVLHGKMPKKLQRLRRQPQDGNGQAAAGGGTAAGGRRTGPHVVFLAPFFEVPHGMAATNRLIMLGRALRHAGARPLILSVLPSGRGPGASNVVSKGEVEGVPFEYVAGSPVKAPTFAGRRADELRSWPLAFARLALLRRQGKLDALYVWPRSLRFTWSRPLLLAMAKSLRVPVVLESNERPWSLDEPGALERAVSPLQGFDGVVCISSYLADWSRQEAARRKLDVQVLEVPILVDPQEQEPVPYPEGDPLLVFAASPGYRTTTEFILEAMPEVWRKHPSCRLVLTGVDPGSRRGAWLAERRRAGQLDERVQLPGRVRRDELLGLYGQAHALLAPLFDDVRSAARFPTKMGEYLASARPIVTTPVGEVTRYFADGETAYIAAACDASAYAAAIDRALAEPAAAAEVGLRGRALCETVFDYRRHGEPLAAFLAALGHRSRRTTATEAAR